MLNYYRGLFIRNCIAFVLGVLILGFHSYQDTHQIRYLLIGGYILLSIYHAWSFGVKHYGNLFSLIVFWLLPLALVFAIFASLTVGFLTSIPRFVYSGYMWRKQYTSNAYVPASIKTENVIPFPSKDKKRFSHIH